MKKIIASLCILLALIGLGSQTVAAASSQRETSGGNEMAEEIDLSEYEFPEGTSEEAKYNTEILYATMQALNDKQLDKANFFFAAKILAKNDIIIADIQLLAADEAGHFLLLVTDQNGIKYEVEINSNGGLPSVLREDGVYIYRTTSGPLIFVEPALKWWQHLLPWMQCILRYVCFGWIWMK